MTTAGLAMNSYEELKHHILTVGSLNFHTFGGVLPFQPDVCRLLVELVADGAHTVTISRHGAAVHADGPEVVLVRLEYRPWPEQHWVMEPPSREATARILAASEPIEEAGQPRTMPGLVTRRRLEPRP